MTVTDDIDWLIDWLIAHLGADAQLQYLFGRYFTGKNTPQQRSDDIEFN